MNKQVPRECLDELMPVVYDELHRFASKALSNERDSISFQTTELVHEAYVRLARIDQMEWTNKDHVIRAAIGVMRRVLIDCARAHRAQKRDSSRIKLQAPNGEFDGSVDPAQDVDLIALDEALDKLREFDARKADIVEMRYFGGQQVTDVARLLDISQATVKRDWALARAWLLRELSGSARPPVPNE